MKVKDFKALLKGLKNTDEIVLSSDSEGNSFCSTMSIEGYTGYKGYVIFPAGHERCDLEEVLKVGG